MEVEGRREFSNKWEMQRERQNEFEINYRGQIPKTLSVSLHVSWCCVPRGATQKTFKTLNYQANVYKYCKIHDKGALSATTRI